MGPCGERGEFIFVDALEGHRVDLDGEPGVLRGLDAVENLIEVTPARHGAELRGIEGIERDVDAPDPVSREIGCIFPELGTVGRQGKLVERARFEMARQ